MGSVQDSYPQIRQVASPLKRKMLAPLSKECEVVQFSSALSEKEYSKLGSFMAGYPEVKLRAYGNYDHSIEDLEFLRHFSSVRSFQFDLYDLTSWAGLRHLPEDLHSLSIGRTKKTSHSLAFLSRHRGLRSLHIEGHKKHISSISDLEQLRRLSLRSITLDDLSVCLPLRELREFELRLGGTTDLRLLPEIGNIRYLEIWMVRGLSDLSPLSEMGHLRTLFLQALRRVTVLPDMTKMTELQTVHLWTMKGVRDMSSFMSAPSLRNLMIFDAGHMQPEDIACLAGHPSLTHASIYMGSERKNRRVRELLPLEVVEPGRPAR